MYGLPQSGIIAQEQLAERLGKEGYKQSTLIPGLWTHDTRPIQFTLVVDDFGVKYTRREDAEHLLKTIKAHYDVTPDWEGRRYIGITLDWDYKVKKVHLSMPGYISDALKEYEHHRPKRKQDSPAPYSPPQYGAKKQYTKQDDESPKLNDKAKKIHTKSNWKIQFYRARRRRNNAASPQQFSHGTSCTNRAYNEKTQTVP